MISYPVNTVFWLEWVSDYCLKSIQQFFSYIMVRTSQFSVRRWWGPLCTRPTRWVGSLVLAHWNNSPRVDMSLHSDTLFWFRANQSLLFLLNAACLAKKLFCSDWMISYPVNTVFWLDDFVSSKYSVLIGWFWNIYEYENHEH